MKKKRFGTPIIFLICFKEERRRTGRFLAGGVALGLILMTVHHLIARGTSTTPNIWVPAIIMACYVMWVLHAAHKDREKASFHSFFLLSVPN